MKLQEIFDALTYGELSQVNLGGNANGFIDNANYNLILNHVNMGLTDLHTRFTLKMKRLELILLEGRTRYHLHSDHKFSDESLTVGDFRLDIGNGTFLTDMQPFSDPEYIRDQPYAHFQDDILKVEEVKTCVGFELNLNVRSDCWSVITPEETVIEVPQLIVAAAFNPGINIPDAYKTDRLDIGYRANHRHLEPGEGEYNAGRVEIELPRPYMQALLFFIASRVHNPIGMSAEFNAGNIWYSKYLNECQLLESKNLQVDLTDQPDRLRRNGWV